MPRAIHRWLVAAGLACALLAHAQVQQPRSNEPASPPRPIDIAPWFTQSFLDLPEELAAASKERKRLLLYFGQDGCPYCRRLMEEGFAQHAIVDKARANFRAIAFDIWGDLDVVWVDGRRMSEKQLARMLKVQFTPTLVFLDEQGRPGTRLNGYWPPHRLSAALDYVIARDDSISLSDHVAAHVKEAARAELSDEPFLLKPPFDLRRRKGAKPLAVLFETRQCQACDEMHAEGLRRPEMRALLKRFDVARFALDDARTITPPDGRAVVVRDWARALRVAYTPSVIFFDDSNREVFRFEGYVRPFHLTGAFDYVAQGAYRTQPEFQRFLHDKADRARERGETIDLWR